MNHVIRVKGTRGGTDFIMYALGRLGHGVTCMVISHHTRETFLTVRNGLPRPWRLRSPTVSAGWTPGKAGGPLGSQWCKFRPRSECPKTRNVKGKESS